MKKSINKDKDCKIVNEKIVEFANRGYRALGVSRCNEMVSPHLGSLPVRRSLVNELPGKLQVVSKGRFHARYRVGYKILIKRKGEREVTSVGSR